MQNLQRKAGVWTWRHAIQQSKVPYTVKLVLLNLPLYMNDIGEGCFPSVTRQASDTSLSERTIYKALDLAIEAGFLTKEKFKKNNNVHNVYLPDFPTPERGAGTPLHDMHPLNEVQHPPAPDAGDPLHQVQTNSPEEYTNELSNKKNIEKKDFGFRGSRLPSDWKLPAEWGNWALGMGMKRDQVIAQQERFRDYWISVPGKKGVKLNWEATWRNWIRTYLEDK